MSEKRIRFTIDVTTTLEPLWYDEQWFQEMMTEGMTEKQALTVMLREGFQEDGFSMLAEMFGNPPEAANNFARSVRGARVVTTNRGSRSAA